MCQVMVRDLADPSILVPPLETCNRRSQAPRGESRQSTVPAEVLWWEKVVLGINPAKVRGEVPAQQAARTSR